MVASLGLLTPIGCGDGGGGGGKGGAGGSVGTGGTSTCGSTAGAAGTGTGGSSAGTTGGGGTSGGAGGNAAACSCPSDLFIDVVGDGATLHLVSGDVSAIHVDALRATACLSPPRPWVEWTSGEISLPYYVQACAGPGGAPPCVLLNGDFVAPGSYGSSYVDRTGRTFRADATIDVPTGPRPELMQAFDASYILKLEDGRTLSGTFHVCLIAIENFA